jgi:hypothetical protein
MPESTVLDLTRIDRTIKREPAYEAKPKYCLLVFGPEARTRVWLVLAGDVIYVDRTGTGDLTAPGSRITASDVHEVTTPGVAFQQWRVFLIGRIAEHSRSHAHTELRLGQFVPKKDLSKVSKENQGVKAMLVKDPETLFVNVAVRLDGVTRQSAGPVFSDKPGTAPIVHFNGPLTFGLWSAPNLECGGPPGELRVTLGSKGLGDCFAHRDYTGVPDDAHPVAEIEFPNRKCGAPPLRSRVVLSERC